MKKSKKNGDTKKGGLFPLGDRTSTWLLQQRQGHVASKRFRWNKKCWNKNPPDKMMGNNPKQKTGKIDLKIRIQATQSAMGLNPRCCGEMGGKG